MDSILFLKEIRKKYKNNPDKMDQELDKLHGRLMTRIVSTSL